MFDAVPLVPEHALQQDPAFAAALKLCGQAPVTLSGGLTVLVRRIAGVRVAMVPRAVPPPDLWAQLVEAGLGRVPLILSPDVPVVGMQGVRLRAAMTVARMDLTADIQAMRGRLHGKWRNQLTRAEGSPLRVASGIMKSDHAVLGLEEEQARERGYVNWPRALTQAFAHAAPDQTRVFTAYLHGTPVSHMVFLLHGARATYHIGHSTPVARSYHAHNLLLWEASCWLAAAGYTSLDLGLLHDKTHSLNRFKLRAGAEALQTGGTWLRWRPF